jgi:hypothetical protein
VSEREQGFREGVEAAAKVAGSWSISRGQVEDLADEIRTLTPPRPIAEPAPSPALDVAAVMDAISESIELGCEYGEPHEKILRRVRADLEALFGGGR